MSEACDCKGKSSMVFLERTWILGFESNAYRCKECDVTIFLR